MHLKLEAKNPGPRGGGGGGGQRGKVWTPQRASGDKRTGPNVRRGSWNLRWGSKSWRGTPSPPLCAPAPHGRAGPGLDLGRSPTFPACAAGGKRRLLPIADLILNGQIKTGIWEDQDHLHSRVCGYRRGCSGVQYNELPLCSTVGIPGSTGTPLRQWTGPPHAGPRAPGWACVEGSRSWTCAEDAPPAGGAPGLSMRVASAQTHQSSEQAGEAGGQEQHPGERPPRVRGPLEGRKRPPTPHPGPRGRPVRGPCRPCLLHAAAHFSPFLPRRSCPSSGPRPGSLQARSRASR